MTILRIPGSYTHAGSGPADSVNVTLAQAPQNGNVLIACIGTRDYSANRTVNSISQQNATWSRQAQQTAGSLQVSEIWLGTVSSGASTSLTIYFSGSASTNASNHVDICEYTPALTLDVAATNTGNGTILNTGTTATTTSSSELWIGTGCTGCTSHTSPTNGFTQLDGAADFNGAMSYLERLVSSTGNATCSVTLGVGTGWVGAIAAFKESGSGSTIVVPYNGRYAGEGSKQTPITWATGITYIMQVESNVDPNNLSLLNGSAIIENLITAVGQRMQLEYFFKTSTTAASKTSLLKTVMWE